MSVKGHGKVNAKEREALEPGVGSFSQRGMTVSRSFLYSSKLSVLEQTE
jgi:hypothetical protein